MRIEDYALIGDTQTAALVSSAGSIDFLCLPRFDSDACFAALLGGPRYGRWLVGPTGEVRRVRRRYRDGTLVLETELEVDGGSVRLVDCMPPRVDAPDLVRIVEGVRGRVPVRMELAPRFGYGATAPWIRRHDERLVSLGAGPDALLLRADVPLRIEEGAVTAELSLSPGERAGFGVVWHLSYEPAPEPPDPYREIEDADAWWRAWSSRCTYRGRWRDAVLRSLITLKALTDSPTGGMVAAVTTSLPEKIGGIRNWDYRYCWLRDATFTLFALMDAGYEDEAVAWRDWLLRAIAGDPAQLQIVYGIGGERRLPEMNVSWLPGYEGSRPVRIGNGAEHQLQLDVYGEVVDCLHQARQRAVPDRAAWDLQRALVEHLEGVWREPDEGIWEVRGGRRPFTYSKVMAWVALDRAVKSVERLGVEGPLDRWRRLRAEIHADVCANAWDPEQNSFTQSYGSKVLDASLLRLPQLGFLPPHDPRMRGTVDAVARELCTEGLVRRYPTAERIDGLPPGEGAFLACSFWLADAYYHTGRERDARELFERLLGLANDVGLLAEEYDPDARRLLGNFPQAFSHVALVNTAMNLERTRGPADRRGA